MIWLLRSWKPVAAVAFALAWSAGMFLWGSGTRDMACQLASQKVEANAQRVIAEFHKAERDAVRKVREVERQSAERMAQVAQQHEQDKANAQQDADRLAADLRSGSARLRDHWQGCQATARVPGAATRASQPDAAARLREADAAAAIGDAKRADDWIRALQQVTQGDRQ